MKNKLIRIISSVLVLAFLLSSFAVLSFADDTAAPEGSEETTNEDVTLLINRTFDEGWVATNGFTSGIKNQKFDIEYEETKEFLYNYYTRVLSTNTNDGYLELRYGTNAADYGPTILEFDLRTDDYNNMGTILYGRAPGGNNGAIINLAAIEENQLKLIAPGTVAVSNDKNSYNLVSYNVGDLSGDWVHVAFVYTVNQRKCPSCGTIHNIDSNTVDSMVICCADLAEPGDGQGSGVPVSKMDKVVSLRTYFGYTETFDMENAIEAGNKSKDDKDLNATYYFDSVIDAIANVDIHRIGIPAVEGSTGQSYCLDNVKLYNGSATSVEFGKDEYGKNVNTALAKTIEILSAGASKTTMQYINSGLVMKVGSEWALSKNERIAIMKNDEGVAYGAPVKIDGQVFVPLQAVLDWVGYPMFEHDDGLSFDISTEMGSTFVTIGRPTATASGEVIELAAAPGMATDAKTGEEYIVVALDDVATLFEGYHVTYDEMGLIIVSDASDHEGNLINRASDLDIMLDLMKSFLFDVAPGDTLYEGVKNNTNNFQHPYILANAEKFAAIKAAYAAVEGDANYDAAFKTYLTAIMIEADTVYGKYSAADPSTNEGKYLAADIVNSQIEDENGGYDDKNGRLDEIAAYAAELRLLALAYQITGEAKYAKLGYEFAVSLAKWEHWGPAYIANTADAVGAYAMAYDWLYNAWVELSYDVSVVEEAIYTKGIYQGYRSSNGLELLYPSNQSEKNNESTKYNTLATSRNAAVTSSMVVASIAILGSDWLAETENVVNVKWLIENNISTLIEIGLDAYAPDGSFAESPSYWNYSTNGLYTMIWVLNDTFGSDMGLSKTWGLDKTFYYAIQTEFKVFGEEGYKYWNYHEATGTYQNTDMYFYAAKVLGDNGIAAVRVEQLNKKAVSVFDILGYDAAFITAALPELELDYRLESVEGFVTRSDWADGSIVLGVMGGDNDTTHGQIDSGNFIYTSQGYNWFIDLGAENLGVANLQNVDYRYGYYRNNAEGSNVIYVTSENSLPYGQALNAGGTITDYYSNEYGMYAIIDNNEVYGSIVNSAHRAILFTNDRNTVVIQDEINYKLIYSSIWVAHTTSEYIQISDDGRTAFLRQPTADGGHVWLRVSLVAENKSLKFETMDAYTFMLSKTNAQNFTTTLGGEPEFDRDPKETGLQKLVINNKNSLAFHVSVVIEVVPDDFTEAPVEYTWTPIDQWSKDMVKKTFVAVEEDGDVPPSVNINDIKTYSEIAGKYIDNGYAFSTRIEDFYRAMRIVAHNVKFYEPSGMIQDIKEIYSAYLDYQNYLIQFNLFRDYLNEHLAENKPIARYLCGYN